MRKFFRHKHFVNLFALLALVLVLFSFSAPKIRDYNSTIEDEQKELRIKADGASDRVIRFSKGYGYKSDLAYCAEIAFSLGLFCSLVLTKRIIFSFLFTFLFGLQFTILFRLFNSVVNFPMSYFYNTPIYSILFVVCVLALSYWHASVIHHIYCRRFQAKDILK